MASSPILARTNEESDPPNVSHLVSIAFFLFSLTRQSSPNPVMEQIYDFQVFVIPVSGTM